jgi:hypothetical protein
MGAGRVTIKIDEKGEIKVETRGMLGPACLDEVLKILQENAAVTEIRKTDEYYMKPGAKIREEAKQKVRQ